MGRGRTLGPNGIHGGSRGHPIAPVKTLAGTLVRHGRPPGEAMYQRRLAHTCRSRSGQALPYRLPPAARPLVICCAYSGKCTVKAPYWMNPLALAGDLRSPYAEHARLSALGFEMEV